MPSLQDILTEAPSPAYPIPHFRISGLADWAAEQGLTTETGVRITSYLGEPWRRADLNAWSTDCGFCAEVVTGETVYEVRAYGDGVRLREVRPMRSIADIIASADWAVHHYQSENDFMILQSLMSRVRILKTELELAREAARTSEASTGKVQILEQELEKAQGALQVKVRRMLKLGTTADAMSQMIYETPAQVREIRDGR